MSDSLATAGPLPLPQAEQPSQFKAKVELTGEGARRTNAKMVPFHFPLSSTRSPNPQDVRLLRPGRSLACGEELATESEELGPPVPTAPAPCQPPPPGCWDLSDTGDGSCSVDGPALTPASSHLPGLPYLPSRSPAITKLLSWHFPRRSHGLRAAEELSSPKLRSRLVAPARIPHTIPGPAPRYTPTLPAVPPWAVRVLATR